MKHLQIAETSVEQKLIRAKLAPTALMIDVIFRFPGVGQAQNIRASTGTDIARNRKTRLLGSSGKTP